jgi:hypothetical protein
VQEQSAFLLVKSLQGQLNNRLLAVDLLSLPTEQAKIVEALKQLAGEVRLDVRDYEFSETRIEQIENAKAAKQRLASLSKNFLAASEYNLFSAADVAQIGAQIEQIIEQLA